MRAALRCGAVKVATGVNEHAPVRNSSVATASEVVKVGFRPAAAGRRQLENRAGSMSTVLNRRAVKIACGVHRQAVVGPRQVGRPGKAVNHPECPTAAGGHYLLNRAAPTWPAATGASIKIARA